MAAARWRAPEAGGGVLAREGLLVVQQQALVRDVELGLGHQGRADVQPARHHERDRLVHAPRLQSRVYIKIKQDTWMVHGDARGHAVWRHS